MAVPKTIADLITEVEKRNGEVTQIKDRTWEFCLPVRMIGGTTPLMIVGTVGYYVRDGKNHIKGTRQVREGIARHTRQFRTV